MYGPGRRTARQNGLVRTRSGWNRLEPAAEPPADAEERRIWLKQMDNWCQVLRFRAWGLLGGIPVVLAVGVYALASGGGGVRLFPLVIVAGVGVVDIWLGLRWRRRAAEAKERIDLVRREFPD